MRYLIYNISKGQSNPSLRDDLPNWLLADADGGDCVIVDLRDNKRYFLEEWEDIEIVEERVLP